MLAAAIRVRMSVWYRQLEWIGESNTPSFSQPRKRMNTLDVNINKGGMITMTYKKHAHTLAVDTTELKQHNRGEWMGKKWKVKRDFVKMHVMVDTQTLKIIAVCITDESVGDASKF